MQQSQIYKLDITLPYNLAKRIIVFVTDPEKVELRLNELRIWLKNNNYPDHYFKCFLQC